MAYVGHLMPKPFSYNLIHTWEDKGVHAFPKGICSKVNEIARLEYELAYNDSAVHRFNHYTTRTPSLSLGDLLVSQNPYRTFCVSFSKTDSGLCVYHLFVWANLNFLHNSLWIIFCCQTYLVLYSFARIYCIRIRCN